MTAFRFVDDLFLGSAATIAHQMDAFTRADVGSRYVWDATGRVNVLHRVDDQVLNTLAGSGLREVALGIESGSDRILASMNKRTTGSMTLSVVRRLLERGINVKGYFILGFPGEDPEDLQATLSHIHDLWELSEHHPGNFRASAFEFRPYPGTPVWHQLIDAGHDPERMLKYTPVDLSDDQAMRDRDEFAFSVDIQFSATPLTTLRGALTLLAREQRDRTPGLAT